MLTYVFVRCGKFLLEMLFQFFIFCFKEIRLLQAIYVHNVIYDNIANTYFVLHDSNYFAIMDEGQVKPECSWVESKNNR